MKPYRRFKIAFVLLLVALFAFPIFVESIFHVLLAGEMIFIWASLFWVATIFLFTLPIVTLVRNRRITLLDFVCWVLLLLAWFVYPSSVRAYCEYANRHRSDSWRWKRSHSTYFFVDSRDPDSGFAGMDRDVPSSFLTPEALNAPDHTAKSAIALRLHAR